MDITDDTSSPFSNEAIDINLIPHAELLDYQPLEPNKLKVSYIGNTIFYLVLSLVLVGLYFSGIDFVQDYWQYCIGVVLVFYILSMVMSKMAFQHKGYLLREKDVAYKNGLIWRSITALPFNRVQHCEVSQGPIERYFDLASIKVFTAGGSASDLTITGLTKEKADSMKSYILNKTSHEEE